MDKIGQCKSENFRVHFVLYTHAMPKPFSFNPLGSARCFIQNKLLQGENLISEFQEKNVLMEIPFVTRESNISVFRKTPYMTNQKHRKCFSQLLGQIYLIEYRVKRIRISVCFYLLEFSLPLYLFLLPFHKKDFKRYRLFFLHFSQFKKLIELR